MLDSTIQTNNHKRSEQIHGFGSPSFRATTTRRGRKTFGAQGNSQAIKRQKASDHGCDSRPFCDANLEVIK